MTTIGNRSTHLLLKSELQNERGVPSARAHDLLPAKDAAAYLKLSTSTLAKLRVYGGGPAYFKLRRRIYYDVVDLDKWINCRRLESTSDRSK